VARERTLSIIKPSAVRDNHIGGIIAKFEAANLRVVAAKMTQLSPAQAEAFYAVHAARPFFAELVEFMTSGAVMIQVLEGENAIQVNRDVMGATNPAEAKPGTIRAEYANSITENAVHGSDAVDTAKTEISFFFSDDEIYSAR
jgi:nucleoside-diphosphate kinase